MQILRYIPASLIALRAVLGPLALVAAWLHAPAFILILTLLAGFTSDVFDGIIARRLHVATAGLRRADSLVDMLFFVCLIAAAWIRYPYVLSSWWPAIAAVAALEVVRDVVDVWKFAREAAYHMWSAKLWSVTLVLGLAVIFITGHAGMFFFAAVIVGFITEIEGLAASIVLPEWHHDVPTIFHAWKLTQRVNHEKSN